MGAVTVIMTRAARLDIYAVLKISKRLANDIPKVKNVTVYRKKLRFIGADDTHKVLAVQIEG